MSRPTSPGSSQAHHLSGLAEAMWYGSGSVAGNSWRRMAEFLFRYREPCPALPLVGRSMVITTSSVSRSVEGVSSQPIRQPSPAGSMRSRKAHGLPSQSSCPSKSRTPSAGVSTSRTPELSPSTAYAPFQPGFTMRICTCCPTPWPSSVILVILPSGPGSIASWAQAMPRVNARMTDGMSGRMVVSPPGRVKWAWAACHTMPRMVCLHVQDCFRGKQWHPES